MCLMMCNFYNPNFLTHAIFQYLQRLFLIRFFPPILTIPNWPLPPNISSSKYRKTSLLTNGRGGKSKRERERPERHTGVGEGSKSRERARLEIGANRA